MRDSEHEGQLSYAEFLAYADGHEGRFEYVDGQAVAMGIPSDAHQDLSLALAVEVDAHLRTMGCRARLAGRLRTGKLERSAERSPDLVVICSGKPSKLVVEIMGPNRGDDLTSKLTEYQAMLEFEEYLVIDSTRRWARVYRRDAEAHFVFDTDHIGGSLRLASIGFTLDVDALYEDAGVA